MDQKTQFIADYLRQTLSVTKLCDLYGVSRTHTITQPRADVLMFWLWWKTLSGSYAVFTSTSRS